MTFSPVSGVLPEGWHNLRKAELEILRQELEVQREWLDVEEKRLRLQSNRTATRMVDRLHVHSNVKEELVSSLVPSLLDLQMNSIGIDQISLIPDDEEK